MSAWVIVPVDQGLQIVASKRTVDAGEDAVLAPVVCVFGHYGVDSFKHRHRLIALAGTSEGQTAFRHFWAKNQADPQIPKIAGHYGVLGEEFVELSTGAESGPFRKVTPGGIHLGGINRKRAHNSGTPECRT